MSPQGPSPAVARGAGRWCAAALLASTLLLLTLASHAEATALTGDGQQGGTGASGGAGASGASGGRRRGVSEGNAAEIYRAAFAGLENRRPKGMTAEEYDELIDLTYAGRVSPKDMDRVRELMTKATPFLDSVVSAGSMRRCDFELDLSRGFELPLPHLADMRATARLLKAQAALALADGDWDQSLASMQSLAWLGNHAGQDHTLISSLVGTATTSLSLAPLDAILDEGTLTQERATALLESLRGVRGDDPFQYSDAMRGEFRLLTGSLNGKDGAEVAAMIGGDGDMEELKALDARDVARAVARARGVYELGAKAFESKDPDAAKKLMEQAERDMERDPLLRALMPSIERALRSKQMIGDELASRIDRLEAIAKGRSTALAMANASSWFRRAAAIAAELPEEAQAALMLAMLGGRSIDASLLDRAERLHLGAGRQILECLERGLACGVVDFDIPNDADYGLSAKWLPGLRGACRVLLARAAVSEAKERAELASIVARTAAALLKDPSAMRVVASRSILDDSLPTLRRVAEERALDEKARMEFAATLRATSASLLAAPGKGLDADRDRLAAASPWGRTIDERRRKILSRRGADFLLFVQVAMAPSELFPTPDSKGFVAKGPLIQFDDLLPPEPCAEARKQSDKVRSLRFFDALRRGPDPDADERELGTFRGISVIPIRDAGKDLADLTTTLEKLDAVTSSLER